jgi:hypothetical protein
MCALRRSEEVETRVQVPLVHRLKCCTQNCNKTLNDPKDTGSFIPVSDIACPLQKIQWMKHSLAQGSTLACAVGTVYVSYQFNHSSEINLNIRERMDI